MRLSRPSSGSLVALVAMLALAVGALRLSGPPRPAGDVTPDASFSAERAMPHVRAFAQAPHPMGSAEHARVRDALAAQLENLGLVVERQRTTGVRVRGGVRSRGTVLAGAVDNLMVRIPGRESTGAVMLACHYDSVPASPGAADDTAAVAAILETLRALQAGPPLRNDVIALFTDGEEDGLLGAEAFVSRHPWARDVRVVLNFEARGNRGTVQMFETTPGNAAVVEAWAEAVPRPAGTSLAYEVYKRLPNDSDFTEFKRMNAVGLNFAFINNVTSYHTPHDSADELDRRSVQGHGEIALSLVRQFGDANLDLKEWRSGDAVFFSLPGGWVVRYSTVWVWPLLAGAFLVWVWATERARRRGETSFGGLILAVLLIGAFFAALAWMGIKVPGWIDALQDRTLPVASPATSQAHALGVMCLALSGWAALYALMRMKFAAHTWALASAWLALLAGGVVAYALPGASYLLLWPGCFALLSVLVAPSGKGKSTAGPRAALVLSVVALPALAILVPTATTVFTALLLSPEGTAGMIVLVGVGVLVLACQVEVVTEGRRWWPAGVLALLGVGALAAGVVTSAHGDDHPRPENVIYALDADAGKALWATPAHPASPWLEQYVSKEPRRGPLAGFSAVAGQAPFLSREAPAIGSPGPEMTLEGQVNEVGGRVLTVRVRSPRRARALSLRIPDREVYDASINGRRPASVPNQAPWAPGRWGLEFTNVPPEGIVVVVRVKGNGPVTLVVADRSDGLPPELTADKNPRPPSSHPIHRGDMTVVQRAFTY
jgi:hypothetical protein